MSAVWHAKKILVDVIQLTCYCNSSWSHKCQEKMRPLVSCMTNPVVIYFVIFTPFISFFHAYLYGRTMGFVLASLSSVAAAWIVHFRLRHHLHVHNTVCEWFAIHWKEMVLLEASLAGVSSFAQYLSRKCVGWMM